MLGVGVLFWGGLIGTGLHFVLPVSHMLSVFFTTAFLTITTCAFALSIRMLNEFDDCQGSLTVRAYIELLCMPVIYVATAVAIVAHGAYLTAIWSGKRLLTRGDV